MLFFGLELLDLMASRSIHEAKFPVRISLAIYSCIYVQYTYVHRSHLLRESLRSMVNLVDVLERHATLRAKARSKEEAPYIRICSRQLLFTVVRRLFADTHEPHCEAAVEPGRFLRDLLRRSGAFHVDSGRHDETEFPSHNRQRGHRLRCTRGTVYCKLTVYSLVLRLKMINVYEHKGGCGCRVAPGVVAALDCAPLAAVPGSRQQLRGALRHAVPLHHLRRRHRRVARHRVGRTGTSGQIISCFKFGITIKCVRVRRRGCARRCACGRRSL